MAKTYDTYKDSGIAWIGEIPSEWEVRRIKNIGDSKNGLTYTPADIVDENEGILVLRSSNIQNGKLCFNDNVYVSCEIPNALWVKKGDIIICSRNGSAELVGKCAMVENDIIATYGAFMMRFQSAYNHKFSYYLLSCAISQYKQFFSTTTINQLTVGIFGRLAIPFTGNKEVQQSIASFLDTKCGEIDALISLQEEMISELQAYKQSVITEAVTKGLNPHAKMKDSGVEWIGEIPEEWKVVKIKNLFRLSTGTTPKSFEDITEGEETVNWYTPSDIIDGGNELWNSQRKLSKRVVENEGIKVFPKHSLIYVGIGATAGKVGYTHEEGYSNQQITALIPKSGGNKYFYYLLNAIRVMIRENAYYTTLPIINNSYLGQREIPCPPLHEQHSIATYLDEKTSQIDSLISLKQEKIQELKDYKKSIIYEYVTGKKRV